MTEKQFVNLELEQNSFIFIFHFENYTDNYTDTRKYCANCSSPGTCQSFSALIETPMPISSKSVNRSWLIALLLLIFYVIRCDLDLWPCDLERPWCVSCDVIKLGAKFEQNRTIHGWVIDHLAHFCPLFVGSCGFSLPTPTKSEARGPN